MRSTIRIEEDSVNVDGTIYTRQGSIPYDDGAKKLGTVYFDGEALGHDVAEKKPPYQVWGDNYVSGPKLPGSGDQLPPIHYDTQQQSGMMFLANPDHPYFDSVPEANVQVVDAQRRSAAVAKQVAELVASGNKDVAAQLTAWETGESTLDPLSMRLLIGVIGSGGEGTKLAGDVYERWYYTRWGRQCNLPGAPVNRQVYTDEQIAAIIAGK